MTYVRFHITLSKSGLILSWWFCCPLQVGTFVPSENPIVIQRTTGAYHGWMALILFVGYLRFTEQLSRQKQPLTFIERIQEWNKQQVRDTASC